MNSTGIDGYRDFLRRRDGGADLLNRRLANREEFFNSLETNPVRSTHPADRPTFLRNLRRWRPEPGVDRKMLFLRAIAKGNQAERFGVGPGETYGLSDEDLPPERAYAELEERTRGHSAAGSSRCRQNTNCPRRGILDVGDHMQMLAQYAWKSARGLMAHEWAHESRAAQ